MQQFDKNSNITRRLKLYAWCLVLIPIPFDLLLKSGEFLYPLSAFIRFIFIYLIIKQKSLNLNILIYIVSLFSLFLLFLIMKVVYIDYELTLLYMKMFIVPCIALLLNVAMRTELAIYILRISLIVYSLNFLLVVLGFLFEVELFAFGSIHRFGYTGALPAAGNEAAILLCVLFTAIFYNNYFKEIFYFSSIQQRVIVLSIFLSCILSGSKIASVYPFLLFFVMIYRWKFIILNISLLTGLYGLYHYYSDGLRVIFGYLVSHYEKNGLLTTLLMGRNQRLYNSDHGLDLPAILVGMQPAINFEMDFLTLVYNNGIILSVLIAIPYLYTILPIFVNCKLAKVYSGIMLSIVFFVGHVFESGFLVVWLVAACKMFASGQKSIATENPSVMMHKVVG